MAEGSEYTEEDTAEDIARAPHRILPVPQAIRDKWPAGFFYTLLHPLEMSYDDELGMCVLDFSHESIDVARLMGYIGEVADAMNLLDDYERLECQEDDEDEGRAAFHWRSRITLMHVRNQNHIDGLRLKIYQLIEGARTTRETEEKIAFLEFQFGDIKPATYPSYPPEEPAQ